MNWISVKDRLPENEQAVLVYVKRMVPCTLEEYEIVMLTAIYTDGKHTIYDSSYYACWNYDDTTYKELTDEDIIKEGWWEIPEGVDDMIEIFGNVTHWMPLPEPPEED